MINVNNTIEHNPGWTISRTFSCLNLLEIGWWSAVIAPPTHTHTYAHTLTHTRAHTHAHTHTHTPYYIISREQCTLPLPARGGSNALPSPFLCADVRYSNTMTSYHLSRLNIKVLYGVHLYGIIVQAWRVMAQGALHQMSDPAFNTTELGLAIAGYDAAWAGYRAYGLAEFYAPSLYVALMTHPLRCFFDNSRTLMMLSDSC